MEKYIKIFWKNQAIKHKNSHKFSWGDNYAIDLEIMNINKYIPKNGLVLDIGCGNGYSTFFYLDKKPKQIIGIDFEEKCIHYANKTKKERDIGKKIIFKTGDIKNLQYKDETFDLVYTTRVLINLPNWEDQIRGINECIRVTKKGGKVIFSEAFWEPLVLINSLRVIKQLKPLIEHDFNRYLKKQKLEAYLNSKNLKFEVNDFCSIYYLGSRFLRELVTNPNDYPGYSNPINKIFYDIEKEFSGGGFGIQQMYIIRK